MKRQTWISTIILVILFVSVQTVFAQDQQPDRPVYIVQEGDTLWAIAQRFGVSMDDLADENGISDPSQLSIGARLVIPGLQGVGGVLVTEPIPLGETLDSLSYRYQVPKDVLIRLNRYTNPEEAYAGSLMIVPVKEEEELTPLGGFASLKMGQSLMEMAINNDVSPWTLLGDNQLSGMWDQLPGENLFLAQGEDPNLGWLPENITAIEIDSLPLAQGDTLLLNIVANQDMMITGSFHDMQLNFFQETDGSYMAMQGIHAMLEPGIYPLIIEGMAGETPFGFEQYLYIADGNFPYDPPLSVASETTDIENNETENAFWSEIVAPVTPDNFWDGVFQSPVPAHLSDCFPSRFGNRRSYNQSGYYFFHSGLDFCGGVGIEIFAPAPGKVVFTGTLTIRGNATVIDHGRGVYSAYGHQSEILVSEGDWVETGQVIGLIGETGRVSGPHLHWEIIVGGIQVDPYPWLSEEYP